MQICQYEPKLSNRTAFFDVNSTLIESIVSANVCAERRFKSTPASGDLHDTVTTTLRIDLIKKH